jgi:DNA adenine methylase
MSRPTAPLQYAGSKATHVEWISEYWPEHRLFVDVFGGSGSVIMNKEPSTREVYNDLDHDLVNFYDVLRWRPEELIQRLRKTPYSRSLHEEWAKSWQKGKRPDDNLDRAVRFFFLINSKWNGYSKRVNGFSTHQGNESSKYSNRVERLREVADRFESVTVEEMDYVDLIDRYDAEDTLFYLDPPYVGKDDIYRVGENFDHSELVEKVSSIEGSACVSYDTLPDEDLSGLDVVENDVHHSGHSKSATERLVLNYKNPITT